MVAATALRRVLQRRFSALIAATCSPDLARCDLRVRLSRWFPCFPPDGAWPDGVAADGRNLDLALMASCVRRAGTRMKMWAPCVSLVRIAARGVCTARRFHSGDSGCRFGCPHTCDELEHFAVCPELNAAVGQLVARHPCCQFVLDGGRICWTVVLLLDATGDVPLRDVRASVVADCILHAHSFARVACQPHAGGSLLASMLARLKMLRTLFDGIEKAFVVVLPR